MLEAREGSKRVPKRVPFLDSFSIDFGGHFGGPKPIKNNNKTDQKWGRFWKGSGKRPGAVFAGFEAPQMQHFGMKMRVPNGVKNKKDVFQKTKENTTFFQYFYGLRGSVFSLKIDSQTGGILDPFRTPLKIVVLLILCCKTCPFGRPIFNKNQHKNTCILGLILEPVFIDFWGPG